MGDKDFAGRRQGFSLGSLCRWFVPIVLVLVLVLDFSRQRCFSVGRLALVGKAGWAERGAEGEGMGMEGRGGAGGGEAKLGSGLVG